MTRSETFNFSAGPSVLPEEVLRQAQAELLNYHGTGMSVMEIESPKSGFFGYLPGCEGAFSRRTVCAGHT